VWELIAEPAAVADPPVGLDDCNLWVSETHQYEASLAAKAGFTIGSVAVTANYRLLVMEVARAATHVVGEVTERWGCGYRLVIEISDISGMASFTLPAIAASVEVSKKEASVRLQVNGYKGDELWDELPVPKPFSVDSYKEYMAAASKVQHLFAANPANATPVRLAVGATQSVAAGGVTQVEATQSVAITLLLNFAAQGVPQDQAVKSVTSLTALEAKDVQQLASGLYLMLDPGGDTKTRASVAQPMLEPLRRGNWKLP
jgi:hypothetical protein